MFRASDLGGVDLAALFNAAPNPYLIVDPGLVIVGVNEAYLRVTQHSRAQLQGRRLFEASPGDPLVAGGPQIRAAYARVLATGRPEHLPQVGYATAQPGGGRQDRTWSVTLTPLLDTAGKVAFVVEHAVDVTELHRLRALASARSAAPGDSDLVRRAGQLQHANLALDEERRHLRNLFEQAPGFMAVTRGSDHVYEIVNAAYQQLIGGRAVLGKTVRQALPELAGQGFFELLDWVYQQNQSHIGKAVKVGLRREVDGEIEDRFVDFLYQPLRDSLGRITGIFVQGHDVTEQKRAELAAMESEGRFRSLAQLMPNHAWTALPNGDLDWFNEQVYAYSGAAPGTLDGQGWASIVHPDDVTPAARLWAAALAEGHFYQSEFRLRRADGLYRWYIARALPVRDAAGTIRLWIGTNTDIEDQKASARVLADLNAELEQRVAARTADLLRAETALRQSQKMEAIGNLAGGIAHDFNNLLQVIGGNLQLLGKSVAGDERAQRRVDNALTGVSRGAKLAAQLLAFGRRQPLEPKAVNLGRLMRDMDDLLRRALGESIEVETVVAGGLWNTLIDPGNVENALLNLALNARDAMDGQGRLTLEAGNVTLDADYAGRNEDLEAGDYVRVAVSDTGSGMTPEVAARAFEPFFSTKPEGKGSGLGLSMVYGFVKQSGGHVKIYSEPGRGTTVKLYLPRALQAEDAPPPTETSADGGSETVLVVEDDAGVRDTAVALLRDLGYRVLQAPDASTALAIVEGGELVDLLFSDVVMPGPLRSTELARLAKQRLPRLAVLFTSGYTENAIIHGGRLDPGVNLLGKPYSAEALARKLRQVLAGAAASTA